MSKPDMGAAVLHTLFQLPTAWPQLIICDGQLGTSVATRCPSSYRYSFGPIKWCHNGTFFGKKKGL